MYKEQQHFSALTFSHPGLLTLDSVIQNALGRYSEKISDVSIYGSPNVWHLCFRSVEPYHQILEGIPSPRRMKMPKVKKIGKNEYFLYDCYLVEFKLEKKKPYYFFAAPFKNIVKNAIDASAPRLKSERLSFYSLNLPELCKQFEKVDGNRNLNITRVNLQSVVETSGLRSMALYGEDVLLSEVYEQIKSYTSPSAIRIVYHSEEGDSIAVNTDRSGNWSFYLRNQSSLRYLDVLLKYFFENSLLKSSYSDPTKRIYSLDDECDSK